MKGVLLLVFLFSGHMVSQAHWSDGDPGLDRMYGDLKNFDMSTNTTVECFNACNATDGCLGWSMMPSGPCAGHGQPAVCWLKGSLGAPMLNPCRIFGIMPGSFLPKAYWEAPVGSLTPTGWLQTQLQIQAAGLSGHLALFWNDIENSIWIGGEGDGGLHERGPYWLNGIVPLAFQTAEPNVTAQMHMYINYILSHQLPSGWLGPDDMPNNGDEYWSRMNVLQSLLQFWQATQDVRVVPAMASYMREARRRMLEVVPLQDWSAVRAQDWILVCHTLIDIFDTLNNVPGGFSESFLWNTADILHTQMLANGGDWKTWYDTDAFPTGVTCAPQPCSLLTHGVNNAQALKSEAVWYRQSSDVTDIDSTYVRLAKLDRYHGAPSGVFQADEHLAGLMPSHGTELCAVVETSFSHAVIGDILGDPIFFERAEKVAYNAIPATMTKDMWAHQYLQQSNEMNAVVSDPHVWVTDGPDSTLYGLEPNYGCCTANMHQGWPKFAQRLIKATPSGGVAVTMWGPATAKLTLLGSGAAASVEVVTDYPFGDDATVTVQAPVGIVVQLRVPSWATSATLAVNGSSPTTIGSYSGQFYNVTTTSTTTVLAVSFNPAIRLERWYNGSVAVFRGALLYGLSIGENFTTLATYAFESRDYSVQPTTNWNVALVIADLANPQQSLTFKRNGPPGPIPYAVNNPPVVINAQGRWINGWQQDQNAAEAPPASPACTGASQCSAPVPITLVPFGSTHLRMSQMPYCTQ
eukprot:TRINITY_DN30900_c0_g1_i1.p1 TRINITY_DN30900_c0_g1~~TRINITY_DN30900_c0_g1_i1.p1  ORF type:complete len:747 (-),score=282.91 TRINITY_DN30900_c0_g1_i1:136-2376(-)